GSSCFARPPRSPAASMFPTPPPNEKPNTRFKYHIHNLWDADFINSIPAVTEVQVILQQIAPKFGYNPSDVSRYNNFFRNVVFSYLSPERLMMIYDKQGLDEVAEEVSKLRRLHVI